MNTTILDLIYNKVFLDIYDENLFSEDFKADENDFLKLLDESLIKKYKYVKHSYNLNIEDLLYTQSVNILDYGIKIGMEIQKSLDKLENQ